MSTTTTVPVCLSWSSEVAMVEGESKHADKELGMDMRHGDIIVVGSTRGLVARVTERTVLRSYPAYVVSTLTHHVVLRVAPSFLSSNLLLFIRYALTPPYLHIAFTPYWLPYVRPAILVASQTYVGRVLFRDTPTLCRLSWTGESLLLCM